MPAWLPNHTEIISVISREERDSEPHKRTVSKEAGLKHRAKAGLSALQINIRKTEDENMSLSKIEIVTGMSKFTGLKAALSKAGVRGMTVMQVLGCGVEKGTKEYEVDENYEMELLPKQQISIVVETERVDEIIELIKQELYTGHIGDGKIFVYEISNVVRVRTGDEGVDAL